jgi:hypothetical protein
MFIEFVKASYLMQNGTQERRQEMKFLEEEMKLVENELNHFVGSLLSDGRTKDSLFSDEYENEEFTQSAVAAEILRFALERLKEKQQNRNKTPDNSVGIQPSIIVSNQFPIISKIDEENTKVLETNKRKAFVLESQNDELVSLESTTDETKAQVDVDILCWFVHTVVDMGACCLAAIKFQPCSQYHEECKAQADMCASNIQILHQKPCLSIDICGGKDIATWTCRVRALAKNPKHLRYCWEQYHWDNAPLYGGTGISAIVHVAAGLLACLPYFPTESGDFGFRPSTSVGRTDNKVFKAYVGTTNTLPNIALIQRYIGEEAMLWESSEFKLKMVEMIRRENDWKGELKVEVFVSILEKLSALHEEGLVHGDIRLANLLSSGYIVDFDFAGLDTYPSGLNLLYKDGKRHPEVVNAIFDGYVDELKPDKKHDWYSMANVLKLFTTNDKKDWWQKVISSVNDGQLGPAMSLLREHRTDTVTLMDPELKLKFG